jgi:RimJ/RimL family protein N-acetyltransferase
MTTQQKESRIVFLEGKKTNLRPISKTDIPTLIRWINDPEVRDFIAAILPQTEQQEEEWLSKLGSDNKNIVLAVETKDGKFIGNMGIHGINWVNRTCTTGAIIGEKDYWGKGFGTDAKMQVLNYIFNTLNLRKVYSEVIAFNKRSLNYSLHCGYKIEGLKKKHIFKKGKYWDFFELCLFKEDWLPIWKKYQKIGRIK